MKVSSLMELKEISSVIEKMEASTHEKSCTSICFHFKISLKKYDLYMQKFATNCYELKVISTMCPFFKVLERAGGPFGPPSPLNQELKYCNGVI